VLFAPKNHGRRKILWQTKKDGRRKILCQTKEIWQEKNIMAKKILVGGKYHGRQKLWLEENIWQTKNYGRRKMADKKTN
jgi:hypothetical protein